MKSNLNSGAALRLNVALNAVAGHVSQAFSQNGCMVDMNADQCRIALKSHIFTQMIAYGIHKNYEAEMQEWALEFYDQHFAKLVESSKAQIKPEQQSKISLFSLKH